MPITTETGLKKAIATEGMRSGLLRALAGNLELSTLWRVSPGGPINVAKEVYKTAEAFFDCKMLECWVANSGRKRRAKDRAVILPSHDRLLKKGRLRK